jgi:hypothetical protein
MITSVINEMMNVTIIPTIEPVKAKTMIPTGIENMKPIKGPTRREMMILISELSRMIGPI